MPTLAQLAIPATKSWEEFEDIATDAFKIRWNNPNLNRHGRQGQGQHGVDIYGEDDLGRSVGIQCKLTQLEITRKIIDEEIVKAEGFGGLSTLYFATTAPRDVSIQRHIRETSSKRILDGKFALGIVFWDDILLEISKDPAVCAKHFPQINFHNIIADEISKTSRMLALLNASYYGIQLTYYMQLLFGEIDSGETEDFHRICSYIYTSCESLDSRSVFKELSSTTRRLDQYVMPWVRGEEERQERWAPADKDAREIETLIEGMEHNLTKQEIISYRLGILLGGWSRALIENPRYAIPAASIRRLNAAFSKLQPSEEILQDITRLLEEGQEDRIGNVYLPDRLLGLARECLYAYSDSHIHTGLS